MSTLDTHLLLNFVNQADTVQEPFFLQLDENRGAIPLQVRPLTVSSWTRASEEYETYLDRALVMEARGRQRVRLYCAKALVSSCRLLVQGGSYQRLGRRQQPILETLVWVRASSRRLRYHHDRPSMRIIEQTRFFSVDGQETSLPQYDQATGSFHHSMEVTGALVVEYSPGFTLYEIEYDTGEAQVPAEWFREMKLAWLAGNLFNATIPPVRIIAMGPKQADQLAFARDFWPSHSSVRTGYRSAVIPHVEPDGEGYQVKPTLDDPCLQRCKEKIQPHGSYLTAAQMQAVRNCVEAEKSPKYQYVEESRTTRIERISAPDNPDVYIDVARPLELVMQLKRADGGVCDNHSPSGCCPELRLRFANGGP